MPKGYVRRVDAPPSPIPPPAPPPAFTCDDPEGEEWFARLPKDAQDEFRARWKKAQDRAAWRERFARVTHQHSMLLGAGVLLVVEIFLGTINPWRWAASVPCGVLVGALWHRFGSGRFESALIAVVPWAVLRLVFMESNADLFSMVFGLAGIVSFSTLVGFLREFRRADDADY